MEKKQSEKLILVLSDTHLGAGQYIFGQKNILEDFFHDEELIAFFQYYSQDQYYDQKIEVILNGDFIDFATVPFVQYYDDEFWSETASLEKLKIIHQGHVEVFNSIDAFLSTPNKSITYIAGNHDAELILPKVRDKFINLFSYSNRSKINIFWEELTYNPNTGIYLQHGHQYEKAHLFDPKESILESQDGEKYFLPPWGTYYCHFVINKFKKERHYINQVTPVRSLLINGLIFDTFLTLRFILANIYYFAMFRFWSLYLSRFNLRKIIKDIREELVLFENYENLARKFFKKVDDAKILVNGHTHFPGYRLYNDGTVYLNSGTWTKIISLNHSHKNGYSLTYVSIDLEKTDYDIKDFQRYVSYDLLEWKGHSRFPFRSYNP